MGFGSDSFINNNKFKKLVTEDFRGRQISFSQYGKYFKCPASWKLSYIDKIKISSESIDLVFGQAMHTVIQSWLKVIYTQTVKKANEMDLNKMLLDNMKSEYLSRMKKQGAHFSTPEEMSSYFNSGVEILNYLKKKRTAYFSTKHTELIAIEYPLCYIVDEKNPNIRFTGYVDLIFYNKQSKKYTVIDLKTSGTGWSDYKKKDDLTTDQLLIYKKILADILKVDPASIDIIYFILKRKINEDSLWPQKRIQEFSPASGTISLKRIEKRLQEFVSQCFTETGDFNVKRHYPAMAGNNMKNCLFCSYNTEQLCPTKDRICE